MSCIYYSNDSSYFIITYTIIINYFGLVHCNNNGHDQDSLDVYQVLSQRKNIISYTTGHEYRRE